MPKPVPQTVSPKDGDQGDRFTVTIKGDVLAEVTITDFGPQVTTLSVKVIGGGEVHAKIMIDPNASPGPRDVVVTTSKGESETLAGAFKVN